eukprot:Sdes_comp22354_c0_seq1m20835
MSQQYWFVSAPTEGIKDKVWNTLNQANFGQIEMSENSRFSIPDLKVGTLDSLMSVSDDMVKIDQFMESVVKKLASHIFELLEDHKDKISESFQVHGMDPDSFICNFEWDTAKYPVKNSVRELVDILNKSISDIESGMKTKFSSYVSLRNNLQAMDRKVTGNLLVRNLDEIVKPEHFVKKSENLITLIVAVPAHSYKEWMSTYESLTKMVVPRSSQMIAEDSEYGLFTVTLFSRVVDEFKNLARE